MKLLSPGLVAAEAEWREMQRSRAPVVPIVSLTSSQRALRDRLLAKKENRELLVQGRKTVDRVTFGSEFERLRAEIRRGCETRSPGLLVADQQKANVSQIAKWCADLIEAARVQRGALHLSRYACYDECGAGQMSEAARRLRDAAELLEDVSDEILKTLPQYPRKAWTRNRSAKPGSSRFEGVGVQVGTCLMSKRVRTGDSARKVPEGARINP